MRALPQKLNHLRRYAACRRGVHVLAGAEDAGPAPPVFDVFDILEQASMPHISRALAGMSPPSRRKERWLARDGVQRRRRADVPVECAWLDDFCRHTSLLGGLGSHKVPGMGYAGG